MADPFELKDIRVRYQESRELGPDSPQQVPVGIRSATATCTKCGTSWHATSGHGPGKFTETLGALWLQCPKCQQRASMQYPELP